MGFFKIFFKKNYLQDSEIIQNRINICNNCPYLLKSTRNCLVCGCFVDLKAQIRQENCPKHNWPKIN